MPRSEPAARRSRRPYAARVPQAERREQLFDAAIAVIVRDGYENVSIDAIAREAGVTRPVVYGAFDGLGQLLTQLLDRQQARATTKLFELIPADPGSVDPEVFIAETIRGLIEQVTSDHLTWRPILLAPQGTPLLVRVRIEADRERVRQRITALLDAFLTPFAGQHLDSEVTAHALLAVAEHFGRLLLEDPDRFEPDRLIASTLALFRALRSSSASPSAARVRSSPR